MDRLEKLAKELDSKDKLNKFKSEFIYPDDKLYFDGNSLGLLSKKTKEAINKVINNEWGQNLISSWNNSWINLPNKVSKKISTILNSNETEIYVGGSTSLNLYKLLLSLIKSNDSIQINVEGDKDQNYEDFDQGQDFFEGRDVNHEKVYANLNYEQFRWDNRNINYYIDDSGNLVARINEGYTYPTGV